MNLLFSHGRLMAMLDVRGVSPSESPSRNSSRKESWHPGCGEEPQ